MDEAARHRDVPASREEGRLSSVRIHDLRERSHHADAVAERIWAAFWRNGGTPLGQIRGGLDGRAPTGLTQREQGCRIVAIVSTWPCEIGEFRRTAAIDRTKSASKHTKCYQCDSTSSTPRELLCPNPGFNRQNLYLRPDPARVVVRFKPATEPRDLNPTDKLRANHIVERVLRLDAELPRTSGSRCSRISKVATGTCSISSRHAPRRWRMRSSHMRH